MNLKGSTDRVLLVICDGMGHSDNTVKNAVKDANTPNLEQIRAEYPMAIIEPGGEAVGLPKGIAGNSEVGHMNLGAGRPVRQDLVRINEAITNKTLETMPKFQDLLDKAKTSNRLHLLCLLSDGGVHSHIEHLKEVLELLKKYRDIKVYLHAFMDGRDTPQTNGEQYVKEILSYENLTFASMQGRSIGMDRDRRWDKIEHAYSTLTGSGKLTEQSPQEYLKSQYDQKIYDEFIEPVLFEKEAAIKSEDPVFFLNFRPDRARQISLAFCQKDFKEFVVSVKPKYFLCMSPYIEEEVPETPVLFTREKIPHTLSEFLSTQGLKQLKIAETEKYAHITYFFNGGEDTPFQGEDRVLIDSPKEVKTYDEKPEMSAPEVCKTLLEKLSDPSYSFYLVNFANPDMVGHTGNYEAAVKAMEYVDHCIGQLKTKCLEENITMLITADHGNCDQMIYENGAPHTSHSKAPVPLHFISKVKPQTIKQDGALKDIAPTVLYLLGITPPSAMTGESVFKD